MMLVGRSAIGEGAGGRQPGGGRLLPSLLRLSTAAGIASAGWPSGRFPCCKSPALLAGLASTLVRLQSGDQGVGFLRSPREIRDGGPRSHMRGGSEAWGDSTQQTAQSIGDRPQNRSADGSRHDPS
jgi:hypothetical protein